MAKLKLSYTVSQNIYFGVVKHMHDAELEYKK